MMYSKCDCCENMFDNGVYFQEIKKKVCIVCALDISNIIENTDYKEVDVAFKILRHNRGFEN